MLIITTQNPTFGRGYFLGFDREEQAHFQSCSDHRVKSYKTRRNAEKQLQRILRASGPFAEGETFSIESAPALPA
jgi:hypothetical protein